MRQPWCRWQRRYEGGCCASAFGSGRLVSHHVAEPMCAAGTALACSAALCSAARPPAECLPWRQRTCVWMPVLQLQSRPWLVVVSWQRPTADSPRLSRTVLGKSAPSQHHRRQVVGLIRLAECVAVRGCLLQVLRGADELLSRAGSLVDTHQCIDDVAVAQAFPTLTTALRLPAQRQKPRRWSHQCLRHARRSKHTVCRPHNVPQHCGKHSCTTTRWCACQRRTCIAAVRGNANHGVAMRAQCNGGSEQVQRMLSSDARLLGKVQTIAARAAAIADATGFGDSNFVAQPALAKRGSRSSHTTASAPVGASSHHTGSKAAATPDLEVRTADCGAGSDASGVVDLCLASHLAHAHTHRRFNSSSVHPRSRPRRCASSWLPPRPTPPLSA